MLKTLLAATGAARVTFLHGAGWSATAESIRTASAIAFTPEGPSPPAPYGEAARTWPIKIWLIKDLADIAALVAFSPRPGVISQSGQINLRARIVSAQRIYLTHCIVEEKNIRCNALNGPIVGGVDHEKEKAATWTNR
jgi:hypothetical protein